MNIKFTKYPGNPVLKPKKGTFYSKYTANPDLLYFKGKYYFFFRGQGSCGHDQIALGFIPENDFDGLHWKIPENNPIIPVSQNPEAFDSGHVLDPAAIVIDNQIYVYYTAHRRDWKNWNIPSYVGLAVSDDGLTFKKVDSNPIIMGLAPEVIRFKGQYYLFFQRLNKNNQMYIYCCPSDDGITFPEKNVKMVFTPSVNPNSFDGYSISTVRIWQEQNWFYMTYGGCDRFPDYPAAIGLARSQDFNQWERYPDNPILERGLPGDWDEGAVWFATVYKHKGTYFLWYEGTGTGLTQNNPEAKKKSLICRSEDYGGYGKFSFSQIGMATFRGKLSSW